MMSMKYANLVTLFLFILTQSPVFAGDKKKMFRNHGRKNINTSKPDKVSNAEPNSINMTNNNVIAGFNNTLETMYKNVKPINSMKEKFNSATVIGTLSGDSINTKTEINKFTRTLNQKFENYKIYKIIDDVDGIHNLICKCRENLNAISGEQSKDPLKEDINYNYENIVNEIDMIQNKYNNVKVDIEVTEKKMENNRDGIALENFNKIIKQVEFQNIPREIRLLRIINANIKKICEHTKNLNNITKNLNIIEDKLTKIKEILDNNKYEDLNDQLKEVGKNYDSYNNVISTRNNVIKEIIGTLGDFNKNISILGSIASYERQLISNITETLQKLFNTITNSDPYNKITVLFTQIKTDIYTKRAQLLIDSIYKVIGHGMETLKALKDENLQELLNHIQNTLCFITNNKNAINGDALKKIRSELDQLTKGINEEQNNRLKKAEEDRKKKEAEEEKRKKEAEKNRKEEEERKKKEEEDRKKKEAEEAARKKKEAEDRNKRLEKESKEFTDIVNAIVKNNQNFIVENEKLKKILSDIKDLKDINETIQVPIKTKENKKTKKKGKEQLQFETKTKVAYINEQIQSINANVLKNAITLNDKVSKFIEEAKFFKINAIKEKYPDIFENIKVNDSNEQKFYKYQRKINGYAKKIKNKATNEIADNKGKIRIFKKKYKDPIDKYKKDIEQLKENTDKILTSVNSKIKEGIINFNKTSDYLIITLKVESDIKPYCTMIEDYYKKEELRNKSFIRDNCFIINGDIDFVNNFEELQKNQNIYINFINTLNNTAIKGRENGKETIIGNLKEKLSDEKKDIENYAGSAGEDNKKYNDLKTEHNNIVSSENKTKFTVDLTNSKLDLINNLNNKLSVQKDDKNKDGKDKIEFKANKDVSDLGNKIDNLIRENNTQIQTLSVLNSLDQATYDIYNTKSLSKKEYIHSQMQGCITGEVNTLIINEINNTKTTLTKNIATLEDLIREYKDYVNKYLKYVSNIRNTWAEDSEWLIDKQSEDKSKLQIYLKEALISKNFELLFLTKFNINEKIKEIERIMKENDQICSNGPGQDQNIINLYNEYISLKKELTDNYNKLNKVDKKTICKIFIWNLLATKQNIKNIFSETVATNEFKNTTELYCIKKSDYISMANKILEMNNKKVTKEEIIGIVDKICQYNEDLNFINSNFYTKNKKGVTPYQYLEDCELNNQNTYGYNTERIHLQRIMFLFRDHLLVKHHEKIINDIIKYIQAVHNILKTVNETNNGKYRGGLPYLKNILYKKINEIWAEEIKDITTYGNVHLNAKINYINEKYGKLYECIDNIENNTNIGDIKFGDIVEQATKETKEKLEESINKYTEIVKKLTNYNVDSKYVNINIINGGNVKTNKISNTIYTKKDNNVLVDCYNNNPKNNNPKNNNECSNLNEYNRIFNENNTFLNKALENIKNQVNVVNYIKERHEDIKEHNKKINTEMFGKNLDANVKEEEGNENVKEEYDETYHIKGDDLKDLNSFNSKMRDFETRIKEINDHSKSLIPKDDILNTLNFTEKYDDLNANNKKYVNDKLRDQYIKLLSEHMNNITKIMNTLEAAINTIFGTDNNDKNNFDNYIFSGENGKLNNENIFSLIKLIKTILALDQHLNNINEALGVLGYTNPNTKIIEDLKTVEDLQKKYTLNKNTMQTCKNSIKEMVEKTIKRSYEMTINVHKKLERKDIIETTLITNEIKKYNEPQAPNVILDNIRDNFIKYIDKQRTNKDAFYEKFTYNFDNDIINMLIESEKENVNEIGNNVIKNYYDEDENVKKIKKGIVNNYFENDVSDNVKKYIIGYEVLYNYKINFNTIKDYIDNKCNDKVLNDLISYDKKYYTFNSLKNRIITKDGKVNKANLDQITEYIEGSKGSWSVHNGKEMNGSNVNDICKTLPLIKLHYETSMINKPKYFDYYANICINYDILCEEKKREINENLNKITNNPKHNASKFAKTLGVNIPKNIDDLYSQINKCKNVMKKAFLGFVAQMAKGAVKMISLTEFAKSIFLEDMNKNI